jgi:hypothetical protein
MDKHDTLEQARATFERVCDPETGRFLFEYVPQRKIVVMYIRGRRIEAHLGQYHDE